MKYLLVVLFLFSGSLFANSKWLEVDRLINEQKYQAALDKTLETLEQARKQKDQGLWTEGLLRSTQLQVGLHGYETSVRFLLEQEWPKDRMGQTLLHLYYAHSLMRYQQMYGWEIGQRETMAKSKNIDLKLWTTAQIAEEIAKSFQKVISEGPNLDQPVPALYASYIQANNYPQGIRPFLRDAVVYMAADFISNTIYWSARESNEIYKLNITKLAAADSQQKGSLSDSSLHPLVRLSNLLREHKNFHLKGRRFEAALEAHYVLQQKLFAALSDQNDKEIVLEQLRRLQKQNTAYAWWSRGQAILAEMIRSTDQPGRLVQALKESEAGIKAYPGTIGAQFCKIVSESILAPEFGVQSMSNDGVNKESILIEYKNLKKLYFRAYAFDPNSNLEKEWHHDVLDNPELQRSLVGGTRALAAYEWSIDLPPTEDYSTHRHFVTPKISKPGFYHVVVSSREDFSGSNNEVKSVRINITDLILALKSNQLGDMEVKVLSAADGAAVSDAKLDLFRFKWGAKAEKSQSVVSSTEGLGIFKSPTKGNEYWNYFIFATKGPNKVYQTDGVYFSSYDEPPPVQASFLFTDRSVYRPQQKLLWKVVAYSGRRSGGQFQTVAVGTPLTVQLEDPNRQAVQKINVMANAFGTASGEMVIPAVRPLGMWTLRVVGAYGHQTQIRVEEYKRPTFEGQILPLAEGTRLNQKTQVLGEVKYYFGQPLTNGHVQWRVTREEIIPWWWNIWGWGWFWPNRMRAAETVAAGQTQLRADGRFTIEFIPEADKRRTNRPGLSYSFQLTADVTDEGGETRTIERSFRLGFVAVEANLVPKNNVFFVGEPLELSSKLANLDGVGIQGQGSYRIVELIQPEKSQLPVDLPYMQNGLEVRRARWETSFDWQSVVTRWKEGKQLASGTVKHSAQGEGWIRSETLKKPGIYRVFYETKDQYGEVFRMSRDVIVASPAMNINLPIVFEFEKTSLLPGEKLRYVINSGIPGQDLLIETYRHQKLIAQRQFRVGKDSPVQELAITEADRGGLTMKVTGFRDHQLLQRENSLHVPWQNKELKLEFATFRDRLTPGNSETFRISVKDHLGRPLAAKVAEILSYMYDRSLDVFMPHNAPDPKTIYPSGTGAISSTYSLKMNHAYYLYGSFSRTGIPPQLIPNSLSFFANYATGGPGRRGMALGSVAQTYEAMDAPSAPSSSSLRAKEVASPADGVSAMNAQEDKSQAETKATEPKTEMRSEFSETAFFKPHLISQADGTVSVEFKVPDSVTSWKVYAHAITRDMRSGSVMKEAQSIKQLMVRPYLPRFLREGDRVEIKVVINNASEQILSGDLKFEILDEKGQVNLNKSFAVSKDTFSFRVEKGGSSHLIVPLVAPKKVGIFSVRVSAKAKNFSDGEIRTFPVLPSRMYLSQSQFVTLKNKSKKTIEFKELLSAQDASRINQSLVLTVDAQLFYGVLTALPYLVNYPYECSEQVMSRFVSTGIIHSVFQKFPAIASMAKEFSKRSSQLETFDAADANRRMALEETPWLNQSQGKASNADDEVLRVLDPKVAETEMKRALKTLKEMQLSSGAWPWFKGGPADNFMTLYLLMGFSRAVEFGVEVPKDMVAKAWRYTRGWLDSELKKMMALNCCWETITLVNFALNSFPDESWSDSAFDKNYRQRLLDYSFSNWKKHAPLLKGYLALTLKRQGRAQDAQLVWSSVMDSAKSNEEQGTYWAPEDRSWLWYNDTIETHAFSLRTLMEVEPNNKHNDGLVQWLFLNKKLNHWKSTKATAEVIYSLAHYLKANQSLGQPESISVDWGNIKQQMQFAPDKYSGGKNQVVISGDKINPQLNSKVTVEKSTQGFAFASAVWHFSTEKLPAKGVGDFFMVERRYFKREMKGGQWTLSPIQAGSTVKVGDQIEVQLSLRSKHEAEYIHLRDPRAAGFEPENAISKYKHDLGLSWYEEVRDSGANFFFSRLPAGEYTFKYRLRANMTGAFRIGPATVQSVYAPEFNAYSGGLVLEVR